MENGLLRLSTRTLVPHRPAYFNEHCLPFPYDPSAGRPDRWLRFLGDLWAGDRESVDALAETMGYVLSGETNQQKIAMLVGPMRSGKGTIGRVLTGLLGAHNVAAPTLASLTQNFGLQVLIGKPLALISDARLSSRADGTIAVERLLSISGEDTLTVDRKYRAPWTGRLPSRFLVMTNELPRFTDASGALASRFVILVLTKSFLGHENPRLSDELLEEAPAIFNWCLEGLDRLRERGHFQEPTSSADAMRHLADLASPVAAFARDACVVDPELEVEKDELWKAWKAWCESEGMHSGTKNVLIRDLRAAHPGIKPARPKRDGDRVHVITGIGLRSTISDIPDIPDQEDARSGMSGMLATVDLIEESESLDGPNATATLDDELRDPDFLSNLRAEGIDLVRIDPSPLPEPVELDAEEAEKVERLAERIGRMTYAELEQEFSPDEHEAEGP
jgi:putative DNA primase/helicase